MRIGVLLVLLAALAPAARADEACEPRVTEVAPVEGQHLGATIETRDCDGARSLSVAVVDPDGRTFVEWYEDERGSGIAVFRPPRLVAWTDDERGCLMVVYTFGPTELPCAAGAPPTPP